MTPQHLSIGSRVAVTAAGALLYPDVKIGDLGRVVKLSIRVTWVVMDGVRYRLPFLTGEVTAVEEVVPNLRPRPPVEERYSLAEIAHAFAMAAADSTEWGDIPMMSERALVTVLKGERATMPLGDAA